MTNTVKIDTQALLEAFLLARRVEAAAPKTLAHYHDSLKPLARAVPFVAAPAVYEYLDGLRGRVSLASYRSYVIDVKTFLRWLHNEGYIETPIRLVTPRLPETMPPSYSREQIHLLLRGIDRRIWAGLRDYTILHVLWDTGARADEVCRLRRQDVNTTTGRMVRLFGKGRGGRQKERLVGISQTTVRVVRRWMRAHRGLPGDYLFPSRKGSRLTVSGLRQMIERRCTATGIEVPRAVHAFRHTFAVQAWEAGADLADLRDDLGHTR